MNTLFVGGALAVAARRKGKKTAKNGSKPAWTGLTRSTGGKPTIYLTATAKAQLDAYIAAAYGEVSGMGTVEIRGDDLVVTGLVLFEQRSDPQNTRIDQEALADYLTDLIDTGGDPDTIHLWWHSHAAMDVFWSGTDLTTIRGFRYAGWLLSIVGNHEGAMRARLDVFHPIPIELDNLPIVVLHDEGEAVDADALQAEVEDKVAGWGTGMWRSRSDDEGSTTVVLHHATASGASPSGPPSFMILPGFTPADIVNVTNNQDGTVSVTYQNGTTVRMDAYGAPLRDSEDEATPVHDPSKGDPDLPVI